MIWPESASYRLMDLDTQFPTSGIVLGGCGKFRCETQLEEVCLCMTGLMVYNQSPIPVPFLHHSQPRWEQGALHSCQNAFSSMMSYTRTPWAKISTWSFSCFLSVSYLVTAIRKIISTDRIWNFRRELSISQVGGRESYIEGPVYRKALGLNDMQRTDDTGQLNPVRKGQERNTRHRSILTSLWVMVACWLWIKKTTEGF